MKESIKIQQALLDWFHKNKRDLPWRRNRSWYRVWISEIMLQQTRVEQVLNYYKIFLSHFPTMELLANADLQEVLKIWEGMGYYSRARNIYKTANIIIHQFNGKFPTNKSEIIKLPGIGEYTAHAILSFVYNKPYSVVDGNVKRVISRLFSISDNINKNQVINNIKFNAETLLPQSDSANFNEAIMELGAIICLPTNPLCSHCPIQSYCEAHSNNLVEYIPFKSQKSAKPLICTIAQVIKNNNKYLIVKRKENGLLGGFWEFPIVDIQKLNMPNSKINRIVSEPIKHSYTHFNLELIPIVVQENMLKLNKKLYVDKKWVPFDDIYKFPIHKAMQKVLTAIDNTN